MKLSNSERNDDNIIEIIEELEEKYEYVYWISYNNNIYIYKPLGRRDYKEISDNDQLSKLDKEDEVIKRCVLYPYDLDLDVLEAGIASNLFKTIMKNSYLDSIQTRMNVLDYFRQEMFNMEEQATCIINEAFPNFDIEEIENWGVEKTSKYLSRAEWKLQNLRGLVFDEQAMEQVREQMLNQENNTNTQEKEQRDPEVPQSNTSKTEEVTTTKKKKERMTPEKLAELKAKFPEIAWDKDVILNEGIEGMKESVDTLPPALRPFGRR